MKKQVFLYSTHHPCTENAMNLNLLKRVCHANGYDVTKDPRKADYLIVATCGFSQEEEDLELKVITDLDKQKKNSARLVVTGCLPSLSKKRVDEVFHGEHVEVTKIEKFNDIMNFDLQTDAFDNNFISEEEYDTDPEIYDFVKIKNRLEKLTFLPFIKVPKTIYPVPSKKWFIIRVSMGCTENCSYCGIKHVHGFTKSTPVESVVEQAKKGIAQGFKVISLSGEDPGSYGVDIGSNIANLLEELLRLPGNFDINLRYISPNWLIKLKDDLISLFNTGRIINFGTPIQSGSNRILELMNRRYDIEEVKETVNHVMEKTKVGMISTNLIVGFPGETEKDFEETLNIFKEVDFGMYMVFRYTDRPGTKASQLPDKVPVKEIERRFKKINRERNKKHLKITLLGDHWLRKN